MTEPDSNLPAVADTAAVPGDGKTDQVVPEETPAANAEGEPLASGAESEPIAADAESEGETPESDRASGSVPLEVLAAHPERQIEMAREALVRGEPALAAAIFQQVARTQPLSFESQEMLGAALCQSGDLGSGITVFEEIVDAHPTNPQAHYNLASAYRQAGRLPDAHHQLDIALRLDPRYRAALLARREWTEDGDETEDEGRRTEDGYEARGTGRGEQSGEASATEEGRRTEDGTGTEDKGAVVEGAVGDEGAVTGEGVLTEGPPAVAAAVAAAPTTAAAPVPAVPTTTAPAAGTTAATTTEAAVAAMPTPAAPTTAAPAPAAAAATAAPAVIGVGPPPSGPTFESHRSPSSAPLELFDEDASPTFGSVLFGTLVRPWSTIIEPLPALADTRSGSGTILAFFLFTSILWGCSLVFHPSGLPPTALTFLEAAALSLVCPALLIVTQTALVALGSASFTGQAFNVDFKTLLARFALTWAAPNLVLMTIAALLEIVTPFPAAWPLAVLAAFWCLALNFRVVTGYYPYDYGRALVVIVLAQITANLFAFAILYVTLIQ